jgi:chromosome segregation ATPase
MENLRKKNETELQNKTEGQSCRIEQTEDRIWELEDEMIIKGKTKELLVKQLKTCEKQMQELTDSIKDQTWESWALKKENRCKYRECIIYSTKY